MRVHVLLRVRDIDQVKITMRADRYTSVYLFVRLQTSVVVVVVVFCGGVVWVVLALVSFFGVVFYPSLLKSVVILCRLPKYVNNRKFSLISLM